MSPEETEAKIAQLEAEISRLKQVWPISGEEVLENKNRITEQLKAIGDAKIAADEEARRAARAKEFCEENATVIGQKKGQIESDHAQINSIKSLCEDLSRALSTNRAESDEAVKVVQNAKQELLKAHAWLVQAQPKLESQSKSVEENSTAASSILLTLQKTDGLVKQLHAQIEQSRMEASGALEKTQSFQKNAEIADIAAKTAQSETEGHREAAGLLLQELSGITTELKKRNEEIIKHRGDLTQLKVQFEALNKEVEGLLPHSAIASLASSFRIQKLRFEEPQKKWLLAFGACIVVLVLLSVPSFISATFGDASASWESIFRGMTMRLPILIPVVWVAIYAGRNYMLSVRLEEDYAYKEAISIAFQGFAREMQNITQLDEKVSPVKTLCDNVLRAIAERPGRIYDGKVSSYSVGEEVFDSANEFRKKQVAL